MAVIKRCDQKQCRGGKGLSGPQFQVEVHHWSGGRNPNRNLKEKQSMEEHCLLPHSPAHAQTIDPRTTCPAMCGGGGHSEPSPPTSMSNQHRHTYTHPQTHLYTGLISEAPFDWDFLIRWFLAVSSWPLKANQDKGQRGGRWCVFWQKYTWLPATRRNECLKRKMC